MVDTDLTVTQWYKGRSLLVTGGTGFMGKILLEKVIRVLPVKKLYVIIREKRGQKPQERLNNILKLPIFDKIRKTEPSLLKKIVAFDGDVTQPYLGLNARLIQELKDNVSVVFHNAASLKLEANLKHAIDFNTKGTKNVMEFCLQLPKVESVVHLSTAFCHVDIDVLEEKLYPSPNKPDEVIYLVDTLDNKSLDLLQPSLISPHPNCYTFSKRLAETVIEEYSTKLPLTIVRPSIVIPAIYEPIPGWVDSLNGPIGLLVAGGKGVIRTMMVDPTSLACVIPVDICINGIIIAACEKTFKKKLGSVEVYNATTSHDIINITWKDVLDIGKKILYKYPFDWPVIWYPDGNMHTNKYVHYFLAFIFHTIPAYFIDFLMFIFFQPRFMIYVHNRIALGLELLQYFTMRHWVFNNSKFRNLPNRLNPDEEYTLYILSREYNIKDYLLTAILGARQYCVKDPLTSLPRARRILKFLYVLHVTVKCVFYYYLCYFVLSIFNLNHLFSINYWSSLIENPALRGIKVN